MTRGLRAVHGAAVDGRWQATSARGAVRADVSADADVLLEVNCWCEFTVVLVPQPELRREGRTRSCGLPRCKAPDGERRVGVRRGARSRVANMRVYKWHAAGNGLWVPPTPLTEVERALVDVFGVRALQRHRREHGRVA